MPRALRNLVCVVGLFGMFGSSLASAQSHSLPLLDALVRFQNAWGVDLAYDAALLDDKTTEWNGPVQNSAQADLDALLSGTGFVGYRLSSGTYSVKPKEDAYASLIGAVRDAINGGPLIRAAVQVVGTTQGTSTDAQGQFLLERLEPGEYTLSASYLGYGSDQQTVLVTPENPATVTFLLEPQLIPLDPVEIYTDLALDMGSLRHPNIITGEQVTQIRGVGTADAIRNINDVPGVRVDEVSSSIHIQGSERGEHQFLLDGNPIFEPVHQHGYVGALNPFAIERLTVDKAGFPASKGSYLAGVINAEHALEDEDSLSFDLHLDPMSINARLNIDAVAENGTRLTVLTAVRKSIWEGGWSPLRSGSIDRLLREWNDPDVFLLRASLYPVKTLRPDYYEEAIKRLDRVPPADVPLMDFHDFHFAGRVQFNDHHTLAASLYRSGDKLYGRRLIATIVADQQNITNPDRYDWVNNSGHLAWSFLPAPNVQVATKVRRSRYHLSHSYAGLDRQNAILVPPGLFAGERLVTDLTPTDDSNKITETSVESTVEVDHDIGFLTSGLVLSSSTHRFAIPSTFPQIIDHQRSSTRLAFYAEERRGSMEGVSLTVGSRLTYLSSHKKLFLEPRVDVKLQSSVGNGGEFLLRGAAGVYSQFINQFDISTLSPSTLIPSTRFWMPVDESLDPPMAYHFSLDLGLRLGPWSFRAESYYKNQPRLFRIDYPTLWSLETGATDGQEPARITTQQGFIALTKGSAYGSAFVVARNSRTLRAGARYEYNIARREYGFRDGVRTEPVPWSEPHRLELTFDWKLHPSFGVTMRWRGGWGRIWAFRQAYYDLLGTDVIQGLTFDGFDFRFPTDPEHRLEPFRQLDMGITYGRPVGVTTWKFQLDLLNVLNRKNEADRNLFESVIEDQVVPQTRYLIGRMLSFSLRLQCCAPS